MPMKNTKSTKAAAATKVKAALAGMIDKAVADRVAAIPAPVAPVAKATDVTPKSAYAREIHKAYEVMTKGATGTTGAGAELSPTKAADFFIPVLAEAAVLMKAGASVYSDYGDSVTIPALRGAGTGAWLAEGASGTDQDPVTGQVILNSFRYQKSIPISGKLLRNPIGQALEAVTDGLLRTSAEAVDAHFLSGTASAGVAPGGIISQMASGQSVAVVKAAALSTNDEIIKDLLTAMKRVRGAKITFDGSESWLMSSGIFYALMGKVNASGGYIFPSLHLDNPTLYGAKVIVTENLHATNPAILFGVFSHVVVGISFAPGVQVDQDVAGRKADTVEAWFSVHGDVKLANDKALAAITGATAAYA